MINFTRLIIIYLIAYLIIPINIVAFGATQTMSTCSSAAWDTAYSAASAGDTIAFPAGTCNLTMTKTIAKANLVILGDGTSNTQITGGFNVTAPAANGLRVTAIRFVGGPAMNASGSGLSGLRYDHCYFYNGNYFFNFYPNVTNSVVDHCTYDTVTGEGNYVWGEVPRSSPGFPYALGAASGGAGVYFEDNTVINASSMAHWIVQSRGGSRVVIRYNRIACPQWDSIDAHDNYEGTSESGSATWEIYNNLFTSGSNSRQVHLRGGQGVAFNNYFSSNTSWSLTLDSYILCNETCVKGSVGICSWQNQGNYIWNNRYNCGSLAGCDPTDLTGCCSGGTVGGYADCAQGGGQSQQLVENVDYWLSAMPGYTIYTYPHPLVSGTPADPTTTITTSDPQNISSDTLAIAGTSTDATSCKWRIGAAPDGSNGTALSGTDSWSGTANGFAEGANTLYAGCVNANNNWISDSITVNYSLPAASVGTISGGHISGGQLF